MNITEFQGRLLLTFRRTGIATEQELKAVSPQHWRRGLGVLMRERLVDAWGRRYVITKKAAPYMAELTNRKHG